MSKIGKMPILVMEGITVALQNSVATVTGPKGVLSFAIPEVIVVKISDGKITVEKKNNDASNALFGLVRAQLANLVKGVSEGFEKKLELVGVGYRAQTSGTNLTISVGFSHPVIIQAPEGIQFKVVENTIIVFGINKDLVGNTAARIRAIRPPEPYKGKGIKYAGERIRRKAGKAAKAVGGK